MKKNLVRCPNCLKQILGEMLPSGTFRIMRFHNGFTDVVGNDFGVICGNCKEIVFIRRGVENGTIAFSYQWESWIHGGTSLQEAGSVLY